MSSNQSRVNLSSGFCNQNVLEATWPDRMLLRLDVHPLLPAVLCDVSGRATLHLF